MTLSLKAFDVGTKCFAKWSEDGVWYNATVENIEDGKFHVTFSDYGNGDQVDQNDLRLYCKDIPPKEELDENVPLPDVVAVEKSSEVIETSSSKTFSVGDIVLAKWSEDDTWYWAKVLTVSGSKASVNFVDYGNEANEPIERIVKLKSQIPENA